MSEGKLFDINGVEWQNFNDKARICVFKPNKSHTLQYTEMMQGAITDEHSHPAEQVTYIQNGYVEASVNGKKYSVGPGGFLYIPSDAPHSVINVGNSTVIAIDVFLPERNDREESKTVKEIKHSW